MTKGNSHINTYSSLEATNYSPIKVNIKNIGERISKSIKTHILTGEYTKLNRHISGGHSEKAIEYMKKNKIEYEINVQYDNGVRVGNITYSKNRIFRTGNNHTWFPDNWNDDQILKAGKYVLNHIPKKKYSDGKQYTMRYNNVDVSIIIRNNKITTIFPNKNQKGVKANDNKTN